MTHNCTTWASGWFPDVKVGGTCVHSGPWMVNLCLMLLLLCRCEDVAYLRNLIADSTFLTSFIIHNFTSRQSFWNNLRKVLFVHLSKFFESHFMVAHVHLWAGLLSHYRGWATGWTVRGRIPVGMRYSTRPDRPWGPPSLLYNGCWVSPRGKVRPGRAADHSPLSSAAIMEE